MNKLKTIIDLVNSGNKAKLWKYLNKGIYSKKDKIDVIKSITSSSIKEGDVLYYQFTGMFSNLFKLKDNITQLAVVSADNMSTGSLSYLEQFISMNDITISNETLFIYGNYMLVNVAGFEYKIGSDLKTPQDIVENDSCKLITKAEYDNIFN